MKNKLLIIFGCMAISGIVIADSTTPVHDAIGESIWGYYNITPLKYAENDKRLIIAKNPIEELLEKIEKRLEAIEKILSEKATVAKIPIPSNRCEMCLLLKDWDKINYICKNPPISEDNKIKKDR